MRKKIVTKKFKIILIDPPWEYRDKCHAGKRGVYYKYKTMRMDKLFRLPVDRLADDDCLLFLWSTFPMLPNALALMEWWGFEYKTVAFVWAKTTKNGKWHWGMGNWTRSNPEICLLGVKGKPKRKSASVHSLVIEKLGIRHSEKPAVVRDKIVELVGDVPRVELFACDRVEGWLAWGNDVESDKEIVDVLG